MKDIKLDSSAMPQNDNSRQFVSRGGIKLQSAIENFKLKIENLVCLDVGSSTGGFVDCLLQNGAKKIYAVDTCYGELAWKLRNDPRVIVMERTNILYLENLPSSVILNEAKRSEESLANASNKESDIHQRSFADAQDDKVEVDLVTIDAGWTKLELILPVVKKFLKPGGQIIALLKPQYEADKKDLVKGVLPVEKAEKVKDQVMKKIVHCQFSIVNYIDSPILGGAGNKEYLLLLKIVP